MNFYFNIYLEGLALMGTRLQTGMAINEGKLEYRPKIKKIYKLKDDLRHIPLRRGKGFGKKKGKEFYDAFNKEFGLTSSNLDDSD